jgi:hypothetical protein
MGKTRQRRIDGEYVDENSSDIILFLKLGKEEERQAQDQKRRLKEWLDANKKHTKHRN